MNRILIFALAVMFSGCFDINLKSELPEINYYDLDNNKASDSPSCGAYNFIALNKIDIPSQFGANKILLKNNAKITYLPSVVLIKSLKESLESIIIKKFNARCIKTIIPPFSAIKIEQILQIKLLDFGLDSNDNSANVAIFYQISQNGQILQSGILNAESKSDDLSSDSAIGALQAALDELIEKLANKIIPK